MANRRMFAKCITGSARFLRMPMSARLLYYDLGMNADDDGVVEAFTVMRINGCTDDDLRVLSAKEFIRVLNDDLVTLITDWDTNNQIRKDRYVPGAYKTLVKQMAEKWQPVGNQTADECHPDGNQMATRWQTNGNQMAPKWQPDGNQMATQNSIGEISKDQNSIEEEVGKNDPPPLNRYVLDNVDLSPTGMESLVEFQKELDADVIRWAVDSAIDNGKRSWLYIERILVRCVEQNLRTLPDVQKAEAKRKAEKASKRVDGGKSVNDFQTHSYTESDFNDSFYYNFGDVNIGAG